MKAEKLDEKPIGSVHLRLPSKCDGQQFASTVSSSQPTNDAIFSIITSPAHPAITPPVIRFMTLMTTPICPGSISLTLQPRGRMSTALGSLVVERGARAGADEAGGAGEGGSGAGRALRLEPLHARGSSMAGLARGLTCASPSPRRPSRAPPPPQPPGRRAAHLCRGLPPRLRCCHPRRAGAAGRPSPPGCPWKVVCGPRRGGLAATADSTAIRVSQPGLLDELAKMKVRPR